MTPWRRLLNPAFVVSVSVLLVSAAGLSAAVNALKLHLRKLPIEVELKMPSVSPQLVGWKRVGDDVKESAEAIEELGTDNYLTRLYEQTNPPAGKPPMHLAVHLAYYTGMIDTVPHVPERCMVAGGWSISGGTEVVPLRLNADLWTPDQDPLPGAAGPLLAARVVYEKQVREADGTLRVRKPRARVRLPLNVGELSLRVTRFAKPGSNQTLYAGYFFLANGSAASSAEEVRLRAFDLRDDYAYYLKVQFSSERVSSAQELADHAGALLNELLPEIMLCVPDWSEVQAGLYPPDNPRGRSAAGNGPGNKGRSTP